jgi:hypothetical protein
VDDQKIRMEVQFVGKDEAYELAKATDAVDLAMEELAKSGSKAEAEIARIGKTTTVSTNNFAGMTQRVTAASYAFQDFTSTSGDLGAKLNSVANNLMGIVGVTGPVGTAIATVGVAAIALYRNWDSVAALWEDRAPIQGLTESLYGLETAVKTNAAALDDLRQKGTLNNAQALEYNRLIKEQAKLEADLAEKREIEAAKKAHGPLSSEAAKGRATGVTKAVEELGGFEAVTAQLQRDFEQRYGPASAEARKQGIEQYGQILTKAMKGEKESMEFLAHEAEGPKGGKAAIMITDLAEFFDPVKKKAKEAYAKGIETLTESTQKRIDAQTKLDEKAIKAGEKEDLTERMTQALARGYTRENVAAVAKAGLAGKAPEGAIDTIVEGILEKISEKDVAAARTREETAATTARKATSAVTKKTEQTSAKETAERIKGFSETTIDEQAEAIAGAMRRGDIGGRMGRGGKMVAADPRKQFDTLFRALREEIDVAYPGLKRGESARMAEQMAKDAFKSVDVMGVILNTQQVMMDKLKAAEAAIYKQGEVAATMNAQARTLINRFPVW